MKNGNIKKIMKISLIIILFINLFICIIGLLFKRPIAIIFGFMSDSPHIYKSQINLFIIIPIIVINILLIILTINKFNKNKLIGIIIFFILTLLMPVYESYSTKATEGLDSYLMGAIMVHKYYNIYGVEIYRYH